MTSLKHSVTFASDSSIYKGSTIYTLEMAALMACPCLHCVPCLHLWSIHLEDLNLLLRVSCLDLAKAIFYFIPIHQDRKTMKRNNWSNNPISQNKHLLQPLPRLYCGENWTELG